MDDNHYQTSQSKSNSQNIHYKLRSSKFLSLNNFVDLFDLPDTDTFHDTPASFANQSNSSLHINHSHPSNRITRTKYDLRPLPRTVYYLSIPSPSTSVDKTCPLKLNRAILLIEIESN